jgi:hypothetical protein
MPPLWFFYSSLALYLWQVLKPSVSTVTDNMQMESGFFGSVDPHLNLNWHLTWIWIGSGSRKPRRQTEYFYEKITKLLFDKLDSGYGTLSEGLAFVSPVRIRQESCFRIRILMYPVPKSWRSTPKHPISNQKN